jgi:5-methylcytosine-specific restriction protein A
MNRIILQPSGRNTKNDFITGNWDNWAEKENYRDIWEECIGDTILFIKNNYIFLVATIYDIDYDEETTPTHPLRYFFENKEYVEIPMEQFNEVIGYKSNFIPRNFMLVRDEYIGEATNFLNSFKLNAYDDEIENEVYQRDIYNLNSSSNKNKINTPQSKRDLIEKNEGEYYPRNLSFAKEALERDDYKCMLNETHSTFKMKSIGKNYMEAHHLIPLKYHEDFNYSLDIPANIISLCPNCHRMIHLGEKRDILQGLEILYEKQKDFLSRCGLDISLEELNYLYNN